MDKEINELLKKAWNCGSVFADDFDTNYNFDSFINREETKALIMHIVSQQRELLLAFLKCYNNGDVTEYGINEVDDFLKHNS